MQDVEQQACIRLIHHYNLLGYIQQTLGSNTEALRYLHKAESVMQEQGKDEAGVQLQVNKANLAWVVRHYPKRLKVKLALASLHCYAHNNEKEQEIYQQLLSKKDDLSLHGQKCLYYSYAHHLHHSRQSRVSVFYYMKAAEIPEMTDCKQKSIIILKNITRRGRDPHCWQIQHFLDGMET